MDLAHVRPSSFLPGSWWPGMPFVVELKSAALVLLPKYDGATAGQLAKFAAIRQ